MYRKTLHKLLTLLLILGLGMSVLVASPRVVRADYDPVTDPPPSGNDDKGIGDPDVPVGKSMPKPVGHGSGHVRNERIGRAMSMDMQGWVFRFRTVLGVWYRAYFHI